MNITSAQYMRTEDAPTVDDHIKAVIDGETLLVPINTGNVHYVAIKRNRKIIPSNIMITMFLEA